MKIAISVIILLISALIDSALSTSTCVAVAFANQPGCSASGIEGFLFELSKTVGDQYCNIDNGVRARKLRGGGGVGLEQQESEERSLLDCEYWCMVLGPYWCSSFCSGERRGLTTEGEDDRRLRQHSRVLASSEGEQFLLDQGFTYVLFYPIDQAIKDYAGQGVSSYNSLMSCKKDIVVMLNKNADTPV